MPTYNLQSGLSRRKSGWAEFFAQQTTMTCRVMLVAIHHLQFLRRKKERTKERKKKRYITQQSNITQQSKKEKRKEIKRKYKKKKKTREEKNRPNPPPLPSQVENISTLPEIRELPEINYQRVYTTP